MGTSDFYIDYNIVVDDWDQEIQDELESKLFDLASEDSDLVGAAVAVTHPVGATTAYLTHTRIVVYGRPDDIAANETSDSVRGSVKGAVDAIIRQVRKKRGKLSETWKRSDMQGDEIRENTLQEDEMVDADIVDDNLSGGELDSEE